MAKKNNKKVIEEAIVYKTRDIWEASFLLASKQKLIGLKSDGRFYQFCFLDKPACEVLSSAYWSGEGKTNARDYASAFKILRDRVYSQKRKIE